MLDRTSLATVRSEHECIETTLRPETTLVTMMLIVINYLRWLSAVMLAYM